MTINSHNNHIIKISDLLALYCNYYELHEAYDKNNKKSSNKPLWVRQIINNILSNENYIGNSDYPRIITEELWNSVQNKKITAVIQCDTIEENRQVKYLY